MGRLLGIIAALAVSVIAPIASGPLESAAQAQPKANTTDGPAVARLKRLFDRRTAAIAKTCNLKEAEGLYKELIASENLLTQQRSVAEETLARLEAQNSPRVKDQEALIEDLKRARDLTVGYGLTVHIGCSPETLRAQIERYKDQCKPDLANSEIAKLERVVAYHKARFEVAKPGANPSAGERAALRQTYLKASNALSAAKAYTPKKKCDEKKDENENVGATDSGGEVVELGGLSSPPTELPEPRSTVDFEADRLRDAARNAQWLLGDWQYVAWEGGVLPTRISFRMESDGTISGYINGLTQEMSDKGYAEGMQLLRGITNPGSAGGTWSFRAEGGEVFSPKDPNRRPGEVFGQAEWKPGGVIFVERANGQLGGTTGFGNRLYWHRGKAVRPDMTWLEEMLEGIDEEMARLAEEGDRPEMLSRLREIAEQLHSAGPYSSEVRDAANMLDLMLDHDELLNDPAYHRALVELEQGTDPETEMQHLRTIASHMVQRAELLGRPVAGNDYSSELAAYMFLTAVNASRFVDDLGNPRGALDKSNMSKLTKGLSTLKGIASLARNPKDQTGRELMHGLRDLSTIPAAKAGLTGIVDFPGEIAAGLIQHSVEGFGFISNAVQEVANRVNGDRSADRRMAHYARRVDRHISQEGYLGAVKDAITNRIANRVPFLRSAYNMVMGP